MIKRNNKGQFVKGTKPMNGFKKGIMIGNKHPMWKGGLPKCIVCGKVLSRRGKKYCNKHSFTPERIEKIKEGRRKCICEKNHNWKGNNVSYRGIHMWIVKNYGKPDKCEKCGKKATGHKMHWANVSGEYKRSRSDWKRLCSMCHGKLDSSSRRLKINKKSHD